MPIQPIVTPRLLLREFVPEDFSAVMRYASDPEVTRHMLWGPNGEVETRGFLNHAIHCQGEARRTAYELAVILKDTNELIGGCGIGIVHADHREGEIGYCFDKAYWGNGYATEAARALLSYGFETLKLHRIYATCSPANHGSAHVLEKCGMQREGVLRQHKWMKGAWRDSFLYSILEQEYQHG